MSAKQVIEHVEQWAQAHGVEFKTHSLVGTGLLCGDKKAVVRNHQGKIYVRQVHDGPEVVFDNVASLDEHLKDVLSVPDPEPDPEEVPELEPELTVDLASELPLSTEEAPASLAVTLLEGSIGTLEKALASGDWDGGLDALLQAELDGKNRKGAKAAIEARKTVVAVK